MGSTRWSRAEPRCTVPVVAHAALVLGLATVVVLFVSRNRARGSSSRLPRADQMNKAIMTQPPARSGALPNDAQCVGSPRGVELRARACVCVGKPRLSVSPSRARALSLPLYRGARSTARFRDDRAARYTCSAPQRAAHREGRRRRQVGVRPAPAGGRRGARRRRAAAAAARRVLVRLGRRVLVRDRAARADGRPVWSSTRSSPGPAARARGAAGRGARARAAGRDLRRLRGSARARRPTFPTLREIMPARHAASTVQARHRRDEVLPATPCRRAARRAGPRALGQRCESTCATHDARRALRAPRRSGARPFPRAGLPQCARYCAPREAAPADLAAARGGRRGGNSSPRHRPRATATRGARSDEGALGRGAHLPSSAGGEGRLLRARPAARRRRRQVVANKIRPQAFGSCTDRERVKLIVTVLEDLQSRRSGQSAQAAPRTSLPLMWSVLE